MSRLNQIARIVRIGLRRDGRRAIFGWKPFSITAYEMVSQLRRFGLDPATIIDGGANVGQFARAALETFPAAHVLAIEPIPEVADELRRNLECTGRATIIQSAIGDRNGSVQFHRNEYSLASSILPLHRNHIEAHPDAVRAEMIDVPIVTLDSLLASSVIRPPILLKLDLQGFELPALEGAVELLEKVDHVLIEMALRELYQGQASFDEVYAFLNQSGFRFVAPIDMLRGSAGEIDQMDALFARRSYPI